MKLLQSRVACCSPARLLVVACFSALTVALVHGVACLHSIDGVDLGAKTLDKVFEMINGPAGRSGLLCSWCGVFFEAVVCCIT